MKTLGRKGDRKKVGPFFIPAGGDLEAGKEWPYSESLGLPFDSYWGGNSLSFHGLESSRSFSSNCRHLVRK